MSYLIGWMVYILAAVAMLGIHFRFFERHLSREWGLVFRVVLFAVLFTPWVVQGAKGYLPAPAFIAVLFNVMAHAREDALRAVAPILGVCLIGITFLLFVVRPDEAQRG